MTRVARIFCALAWLALSASAFAAGLNFAGAPLTPGGTVRVSVPLSDLGWNKREQASFFIQLLGQDVEMERHPDIGTLNLTVPDELFAIENWWV